MKRPIRIFCLVLAVALLLSCHAFASGEAADTTMTVVAGQTVTIDQTTELERLIVEEGGVLTAPEGKAITLTVNGKETGQLLVSTAGTDTAIQPGEYFGKVVITITDEICTDYQGLSFPIRTAVYLDENGVAEDKSVLAAVTGGDLDTLDNIKIHSDAEAFNGIYAADGEHTVTNATIYLTGNGRSDMVGQGAAIYADGEDTRLVIDNSTIYTTGVVRTTAISNNGANLIVKNSTLVANDGVLPEDYVPSVDLAQMRGGFPIGGSIGNSRATNILGENTRSTYINSWISAEGWGTLSSDGCTNPCLTGINSVISLTGDDIGGYGSYAIGDINLRYLGCTFYVDYDTVSFKVGSAYLGDSTPDAVAALNEELDLRLTDEELAAIPCQPTIVDSKRFGFVASGTGSLVIDGGTQIHSGEAFLLNMGQSDFTLTVDGADGAKIYSENGIIIQLMDSDSPGPSGDPYTEPTEAPVAEASFEPASMDSATVSNFSNIELTGDFYNSIGYTKTTGMLNMALNFDNAVINGVISSASAHHLQDELYVDENDYKLFGVLEHTPCEAVNNGVIVDLAGGSIWNVTGDSYLTSLTVEAGSVINGVVTVDGAVVDVTSGGSWIGNILVTAK